MKDEIRIEKYSLGAFLKWLEKQRISSQRRAIAMVCSSITIN